MTSSWMGAVALALCALTAPAAAQATPSVQEQGAQTSAWLSATLHAHVDQRPVLVTATPVGVEGEFGDGVIRLSPDLAEGFTTPPKHGSWVGNAASPMYLIHESLHRSETQPCWHANAGAGEAGDEEGVVQALTMDLLPAWSQAFWGSARWADGQATIYSADVSRVRAYSHFGSGARSWRDRSARLWRRTFWAASCEVRAQMVAQASAAR